MALNRANSEQPLRAPCFRGMATANIHDRDSLARLYPPDAFASDATENDRAKVLVLKGVRIGSAPDEAGDFTLERAAQHAGEAPGAAVLAPFHRAAPSENATADPDPQQGYEAFLSEIVDAASHFGYRAETSPGPGDPRLKGARQ